MAKPSSSTALTLANKIIDLGVEGRAPGMRSSKELADDFLSDHRFDSDDDRIDSLIRWQVARCGGTGFTTGLGGLITLPVALPAGLAAAYIIQARMVGSIAHIRGYDLQDERVRTLVLATLAGDALVTQTMKGFGGQFAVKTGTAMTNKIPGKIFIEINKKIGYRLITKSGSKGLINLTKIVPVLGGVVGGSVDAMATRTVGGVAKRAFPEDRSTPGVSAHGT